MTKHLFVIDDTGSPGNKSESLMLKSDRKTYVGVFISEEIKTPIILGLQNIKKKFSDKGLKINELHFTDIINRRKEYKKFKEEDILEIFQDIQNLLSKFHLPYFVQSATPRTLEENGLFLIKYIESPENLSLDKIALNFLLQRLKLFIEENQLKDKFEIIIDSGLKKDGENEKIDLFKGLLKDNIMTYRSSENYLLLQIADLFAFIVNRMQMLLIKDKRTAFDVKLVTILSKIIEGNGVSGITEKNIDLTTYTKEDYDHFRLNDVKEKGNYDYWAKINGK